jgi:hypothetical protein
MLLLPLQVLFVRHLLLQQELGCCLQQLRVGSVLVCIAAGVHCAGGLEPRSEALPLHTQQSAVTWVQDLCGRHMAHALTGIVRLRYGGEASLNF